MVANLICIETVLSCVEFYQMLKMSFQSFKTIINHIFIKIYGYINYIIRN